MTQILQNLNLYLIGMMGSGKSTVGKILAHQLGYRFFDTDILIEKVTQSTITEIFAKEGEAYFRQMEHQVLSEVAACTQSVIATGGGIVLKSENWGYLRHGVIVWLSAPVELLVERLAADDTRPLLAQRDLSAKLTQLLAERHHLYQEADLVIPITAEQTPEAIAAQILEQIPSILKPALSNDLQAQWN
jgi:shikimate kinase